MNDSTATTTPAQDPYELRIEPDFNKDYFGNPYDFQVMGGQMTRNAILHALLPKGLSAPKHNALFIVLQLLQVRLYFGARRRKPSLIPKLGNYRYTWDNVPVMAGQVHMTPRAFRDNVGELVNIGIVHRVTGTNGEPNHYRFTDAAFKMAHALQTPLRVIKCEGEHVRCQGPKLQGLNGAQGKDWQSLRLIEDDAIRLHVNVFCRWMTSEENISAKWYDQRLANGNLRHPETLAEWADAKALVDEYKDKICPV